MKKLLLTLLGLAMLAGATARDYEKSIVGVRAGVNFAKMHASGLSTDARTGFHLGVSFQDAIMKSAPLFFESGLMLTQKGYKEDHGAGYLSVRPLYLEWPVMVNYKFFVNDDINIYPSAGFYYALGVGGKCRYKDYGNGSTMPNKPKIFGSDGFMKRSDLGFRVTASIAIHSVSIGLGYERGLLNVAKDPAIDKINTGNFFITVGYAW